MDSASGGQNEFMGSRRARGRQRLRSIDTCDGKITQVVLRVCQRILDLRGQIENITAINGDVGRTSGNGYWHRLLRLCALTMSRGWPGPCDVAGPKSSGDTAWSCLQVAM